MSHTPVATRLRPQILVAAAVTVVLGAGLFFVRDALKTGAGAWLRPAAPVLHNDALITEVLQSPDRTVPSVDCGRVRCLALTFDDGPNPIVTPMILDVLERQHVQATFFVVGSRAVSQGSMLRRIHAGGNEIGNHSWSHGNMAEMSADQVSREINQTQAAVTTAGVPAPRLFRPPYGAVNNTMRNTIPMTFAMWNADPLDWQEKDPNKIKDRILAEAKPGGVIDLHDIYPTTAEAIEPAIQELKAKYQLVTFSEMFNLQPGQRGEYFGR